jgi:hypothetical protein
VGSVWLNLANKENTGYCIIKSRLSVAVLFVFNNLIISSGPLSRGPISQYLTLHNDGLHNSRPLEFYIFLREASFHLASTAKALQHPSKKALEGFVGDCTYKQD